MEWLQDQEECNVHNMAVLKELRALAARKRISKMKQKKINRLWFLNRLITEDANTRQLRKIDNCGGRENASKMRLRPTALWSQGSHQSQLQTILYCLSIFRAYKIHRLP